MALPDSSPALTRPGSLDLPCPAATDGRLELLVGAGEVTVVRDPAARQVRVELRDLRGGRLTTRSASGSVLVSLEGTGNPRAAVLVTLPPGPALTVRTRSAAVLVLTALTAGPGRSEEAGPVEVHAVDGSVEFRRAGGPVAFRTESGTVTVTGPTGKLTGATVSGGVHLDLSPAGRTPAAADRSVEVTTDSGPIAARVPSGEAAQVRASSGTGRVVSDLPAPAGSLGDPGGPARPPARWSLVSRSGGVALLRRAPDAPSRGGVG
ncbi:hypothetical protein [Streptomyces lonarensis]|uniref:Adhesin domain-containing protein n=1 Tax=Streptomyces lonarensis TaxID=700599 RepID=A0A7X6I0N1_9ACTN|nr:hypothetical protein [Streptomyces lonarensis]NJQ07680.1 hypothetical protein [Streptomyces lonarensis]